MTMQQVKVPENWQGSEASFIAFNALVNAGKKAGRDFTYSPSIAGRRMGLGADVDFVFTNPPDLAMKVREGFYTHHSGIETRGTDILSKAQLAGHGITLIMLDNDKLIQDPDWLIEEALQYRDHSME